LSPEKAGTARCFKSHIEFLFRPGLLPILAI
jgi:hypothetical protein